MAKSIGMIETTGMVQATKAADAALKSAASDKMEVALNL